MEHEPFYNQGFDCWYYPQEMYDKLRAENETLREQIANAHGESSPTEKTARLPANEASKRDEESICSCAAGPWVDGEPAEDGLYLLETKGPRSPEYSAWWYDEIFLWYGPPILRHAKINTKEK